MGLLIIAGLLEYKITIEKEWLWIIVSAILIALLTVDIITAFIFIIIVIVVYFKLYYRPPPQPKYLPEFTTEEGLNDVQSNIVNDTAEDYKGITGVYGEEVYSAQGSL